MKSNKEIIESWAMGIPAKNKNMSTDGKNLFSYRQKIGFSVDAKNFVYNYMGKDMISRTTSHHVSMAKQYATAVSVP